MTALATGPYGLDEYRLAVEAERAKRSLRVFMQAGLEPDRPRCRSCRTGTSTVWPTTWRRASRGQILRLAINVPPGSRSR